MAEVNFSPGLNPEQRAAVNSEKNTVVAAGAGSGKTTVLASRYVRLVTEKAFKVEEILTLTFTRKAAAEMYQRIYAALREKAASGGSGAEKAATAAGNFYHARIQTLDSYCASVVKQAASRYGIPPDFVIDADRSQAIALENALPFLISRRHHPAIERLYRKKSPAALGELFSETVLGYSYFDQAPDFRKDVEKQFALAAAEWKTLSVQILSCLEELNIRREEMEWDKFIAALNPLLDTYAQEGVPSAEYVEIRRWFDSLLDLPSEECAARENPVRDKIVRFTAFLHDICSVKLNLGKRDSPLKESFRNLKSLFETYSSLGVFVLQAGLCLSVASLLNEFQELFLEKKRRLGVLTFNDVARLARAILRDYPEIRRNEKESFKAIMIDEFQDNNDLQKDLLFLLAEKPARMEKGVPGAGDIIPDRLFFVGDEKQSIYRFRGADVSVFRGLKQELGAEALRLSLNYRSSPALIGAFNALFGGGEFDPLGEKESGSYASVFINPKEAGDTLPAFEAAYMPLRASREFPGKLSVCLYDKSGGTGEAGEGGGVAGGTPPAEGGSEGPKGRNEGGDFPPHENDETDESGEDRDEGLSDQEMYDANENEAVFTAEKIKALLEEGGNGKYRPEDIVILFRTHTPQRLFEKHLSLLNIPYTVEDLGGFFSGGPVNDLLALLRLACYPTDTEAYAETLRSPFAGLSLKGLSACLASYRPDIPAETEAPAPGQDAGESPGPFSTAALPLLSNRDRQKYLAGKEVYERIRASMSSLTISGLVSELWYAEGYRYETEWNSQAAAYREMYDYLFKLAVKADAEGIGLAAFTSRMRLFRESGERLEGMDIPLERPGAVRLMTIHKSKGLEFPVVFLCCAGNRGRSSGGDAAVYRNPRAGLCLDLPLPAEFTGLDKVKRNYFYEESRREEKDRRRAELRRILYVAMTRAEKELYITGSLSFGKDNAESNPWRRLRAAAEKKIQDQEGKLKQEGSGLHAGDNVLDNDTLLGLLLPALACRIPEALPRRGDPSLFFRLETIEARSPEGIRNRELSARPGALPNTRQGMIQFLRRAAPLYEKARVLQRPEVRDNHFSAVSFAAPGKSPGFDPWEIDPEHSGLPAGDIFADIDPILKRRALGDSSESGGFDAAAFGTIAHCCVEALLDKKEALIPPRLGGRLSPAESARLLAAGTELAKRFLASPLGTLARKAPRRESEWPFRSLVKTAAGEEIFITGSIDLAFMEDDMVYVVDFKTDSLENPAEHIPQMSFYYQAAGSLWSGAKRPRLWLYYLRSGRGVEMTSAVREISVDEQAAVLGIKGPRLPID